MHLHHTQSGKHNNHPKWLVTILLSWGTFVFALFFATLIGSMARQAGASKLLQQGIQAGLVTLMTVPLLYILLKRFSSRPFYSIGLSGWRQAIPKAIMGAMYVIILSGSGFTIAHLLGWIKVAQFHFSAHLVTVLLLNMIIAFFYEAFPEELTFRGTVYNALNRRFNCFISLLLQPILFVLAPLTVSGLQYIAGIESPAITLDYIVLLLSFGFILQLLRIVTGSLWTSIAFHLAFLENSRFFVLQGDERFITYEEIVPGTGALFVIFFMLLIVGTLLLIPAVIARRNTIQRHNKNKRDDQDV
ncbi:CPBP family intramembrane glutamic endopeptidase [Bacillus inaquosorum]|uniref:CPBP family intramembrane glutamic endopeptidase n=1 Tax=Bacillus inaquosorum TaxID=483913 RepID=UPI002282B103|nr:type II CAAX endopeptidase family protein [Bacillus inaquosorum]MCY8493086.1 CPBP family intramembrane metalloprotease [Bacillus inaquosorum]MCY8724531.1 CPBP family intramembrane metalloprotease [Bacillus inaquosorum]MCY8850822.1 CPBP family intramembrane metalloprotease [Bacillus inaquosorum]MCY9067506.1 CPBP family intramembrane metalloprotease [Bacillus inaquosorum]MEC0639215.1 type II CAAX endopeptidase family protein [Bacillus inaquosorum]